jgi:hypothetical protein
VGLSGQAQAAELAECCECRWAAEPPACGARRPLRRPRVPGSEVPAGLTAGASPGPSGSGRRPGAGLTSHGRASESTVTVLEAQRARRRATAAESPSPTCGQADGRSILTGTCTEPWPGHISSTLRLDSGNLKVS